MEKQSNPVPEQFREHLFKPGVSGNPEGRKPDTEEQKVIKKVRRDLVEDFKDALAQSLPMINPVLVAKAMTGDVPAIKEVLDRVMDKAKQPTELSGKDGKDLFPNQESKDKANGLISIFLNDNTGNTSQ